jgi:hypothetical protein
MSKGPGRVERIIEEAFKGNPDGYFTVKDLCRLAFACWSRPSKSQRVAVLRAAKNVAARLYWVRFYTSERGSEVVYANGLSLRSYGLGRVCAQVGANGCGSDIQGKLLRGRELIFYQLNNDYAKGKMKPGGEWWLDVERNKALASGDEAHAAELGDKLQKMRDADEQLFLKKLEDIARAKQWSG